MKNDLPHAIDVVEASASKIDSVDFDNLIFGNVFTEHMMMYDYVDGEWQTPSIQPYGPIQLEPSAKVFHYGQAIFEGMKAFKDDEDQVWLFRPEDNFKRFNKSSVRLAIPEIPKEIFFEG